MLNLLLSEKRTLDHWVTVQFFFSLAQIRCFWRCFCFRSGLVALFLKTSERGDSSFSSLLVKLSQVFESALLDSRAVVKSTFVESKTSPSPKRFESKSSPSPKRFESESSPSPKRFESKSKSKSKWDGQNRERKKYLLQNHLLNYW